MLVWDTMIFTNKHYSEENISAKHDGTSTIQRVEVPLTFDTEFFDVLHNDVLQLDTIQESEQASLASQIIALSSDVAQMSKPHKFAKSDMYQWYVWIFYQLHVDHLVNMVLILLSIGVSSLSYILKLLHSSRHEKLMVALETAALQPNSFRGSRTKLRDGGLRHLLSYPQVAKHLTGLLL